MKIFYYLLVLIISYFFFSCNKEITTSAEIPVEGGQIIISSYPTGAKIFLDGKNTGFITPDTLVWIEEKVHQVTLSHFLFRDSSFSIEVKNDSANSKFVDFYVNPTMRGSISFQTTPVSNAEIYLNDSALGKKTPFLLNNVIPGDYKVKFKTKGFWDETISITVRSSPYTTLAYSPLIDTSAWVNYTTKYCSIPTNSITKIAIDKKGIKWLAYGQGLVKFDDVNWNIYNSQNSQLPEGQIYNITVSNDNKKWFCHDKGLISFDDMNNTWFIYNTSNSGLPTNQITSLAFEQNGTMWIGTKDKGVVKYDGTTWTLYNSTTIGMKVNFVNQVFIDFFNRKWIATSNDGLFMIDTVSWHVFDKITTRREKPPTPLEPSPYIPGFPSNNITAIAVDPITGDAWVSIGKQPPDGGGCAVYRSSVMYWKIYKDTPSDNVTSVAFDHESRAYIGSYGVGVTRFNGAFYNFSIPHIKTNAVNHIAVDQQGYKWIATAGDGLLKFKGK